MNKVILIRIGEIFLKGRNKRFFEKQLVFNIQNALKDIPHKLSFERNRMIIYDFDTSLEQTLISKLSKVFGIHSISIAMQVKTDLDKIAVICAENAPKVGLFRVTVNRADKSIKKTSTQIAAEIGAYMLNHAKKLKVDLFNYDFEVSVDIRENGISYIFHNKIVGAGGLPIGCSGKGMLLLSGGIDSPVAAYKMAKRGVQIYAVHYHSFPYTSQKAKEKVIDIANKISSYCGAVELTIVPFTEIQYAIKENCPANYTIAIMRRFMTRIAERLAKAKGCGVLITGESLGQVASQTMESITSTDSAVDMPIFRPLIGCDKLEIIDCAKHIDTYDLSILPYEDCCTVFLPDNPIIKPDLAQVLDMEQKIDIEELVDNAIKSIETIICVG